MSVKFTVHPKSTTLYKVRGLWREYHIQQSNVEGWFNWEAAGNNGREPSKEQAEQRARRWLRDGQ